MFPEDSPGDRILPRAIAPLLETALRTMRIVVVTGPRQGPPRAGLPPQL